ncbi:hypothetical protein SASPL_112430 [Salvia splendens]|uniref:Uncharacterized protein n=1 Tax=Salvia splendens TaxID=180675 RepID=A0A8X8YAQ8_SALSN|nr:hypothetical protein SASPL_112430 [Salvia splendens]
MDAKDVLGNNDIDDVRWLCSLTETELDLVIGLKNLVNMRANKIGHEDLAKKFDLHMLRTFTFGAFLVFMINSAPYLERPATRLKLHGTFKLPIDL